MNCPACDHENLPGDDLCGNCGVDLAGLDVAAWDVNPEDPFLATTLGSLSLKDPIVLAPRASVAEAVDLMKERHEGCVFIEDESAGLVGVFGERDVTVRVIARERDPKKTRLDEVMTRNPVTLEKNDALAWALHRMGVDGHRHLPVTHEGRLVGLLSIRTVLQALVDA